MITILLKPFAELWQALIRHHRKRVHNDPDVVHLREQQREAQESNRRLNAVERRYLGDRP